MDPCPSRAVHHAKAGSSARNIFSPRNSAFSAPSAFSSVFRLRFCATPPAALGGEGVGEWGSGGVGEYARQDLNLRPSVSKTDALSRLSYERVGEIVFAKRGPRKKGQRGKGAEWQSGKGAKGGNQPVEFSSVSRTRSALRAPSSAPSHSAPLSLSPSAPSTFPHYPLPPWKQESSVSPTSAKAPFLTP